MDKSDKIKREIKQLSGRRGIGRDRSFAVAVDLSFEGTNLWRVGMGLPVLTKEEFNRLSNS